MAKDAVYPKGIAKREEILDEALSVFAEEGYFGTSLRQIAQASGVSQAGLLHYFDSKEDLYVEILRKRDEHDAEMLGDRPVDLALVVEIVRHNSKVPGLVELFAVISSAATNPKHSGHDFFRGRYASLRDSVRLSIQQAQAADEIDRSLDPGMVATLLLAVADGMQLQWLYDPSRDMGEHLSYLWKLLLTFRSTPTT